MSKRQPRQIGSLLITDQIFHTEVTFSEFEKILGKGPPVRKRRRKHVGKSLSP
jgi:hypothetical protein